VQPSKLKVAGSNPAGVASKVINLDHYCSDKSSRELLLGSHGEEKSKWRTLQGSYTQLSC
jgi:hypothetical protein